MAHPVWLMHCSSVCAKFSMMTMALAPESWSWCSSSRGVYSGLTLTNDDGRAQDGCHRHRVLRHALGIMMATRGRPLTSPEALEIRCQRLAQRIHLRIADVLAHEAVGRV